MVKDSINEDWRDWVKRQLERGVSKKTLQNRLEEQNYSEKIICEVLANTTPTTTENTTENTTPTNVLETNSNHNLINQDPEIYTISDFLTEEECQHFIDISNGKLNRALVSGEKKGYKSDGRSGSNMWIPHNHDGITFQVAKRISETVNIPLERAERFQVIHYGITQEYRNHYDSWIHDGSQKTLRCMRRGGARVLTALCYLNDVKKGGGTRFPRLNKTITSKRGKIVIFRNLLPDSNVRYPLSEHAGMPVSEGEKYAFNLWFRECPVKMLYKDYNPDYYLSEIN